MIQLNVINVGSWRRDVEFGDFYPEGARPKFAVFSPEVVDETILKPNWRYLFKRSDPRYPKQFWAEIIAHIIGNALDIPTPPAYVAYDRRADCYGALIEWFYNDSFESFVSAGNYFQRIDPLFDREKGKTHNYTDAIQVAGLQLGSIAAAEKQFAEMFLLDTVIGNTDRHQENWGFIESHAGPHAYNTNKKLCPWFDNGTSLGHERHMHIVANWGDRQYREYVMKGRNHMRHEKSSERRLSHFDSLELISRDNDYITDHLVRTVSRVSEDTLEWLMRALTSLNLMEDLSLDVERAEFIKRLILLRKSIILEMLT